MKTTFYVAFAIANNETKNFFAGSFSTSDSTLVDTLKKEQSNTLTQTTLADYVINHPEYYSHCSSFASSLKYFAPEYFRGNLLGVFLEKSEADHRVQLVLEQFARSIKENRRYYNECYNLNEHIENEEEAKESIGGLSARAKAKYDEYVEELTTERKNSKSEVKKQSITIVEKETGEEHSFETKGDCMSWLNCATDTFARFLKGQSKLNKKFDIKGEIQES